jgi:MurNAc alpha-1-phosphate uridylyltransferase
MAGTLNSAMVLCAGLGTRMATPANNTLPKPLVQLGGKALVDHALNRLAAASIKRAVVNVHYKADLIEQHLRERKAPRIEISDERAALLDTGGGVKKALPRLGPGAFLIHNADSVWIEGVGSNLARLSAAWDDAPWIACCCWRSPDSHGYQGRGDFALDSDGVIAASVEQEIVPSPHRRVDRPSVCSTAPGGHLRSTSYGGAIGAGRAYGVRMDGEWMHVGTPSALAEAEQCLSRTQQV